MRSANLVVAVLFVVYRIYCHIKPDATVARGYVSVIVTVVLLVSFFILKRLYDPQRGASIFGIPLTDGLRTQPNATVDRAFVWISNILVLALISTYTTGYVLIAWKYRFSTPTVFVFVVAWAISAFTGAIARRYISPSTLLAYGLSFTVGMFLAIAMFLAVVGIRHAG